jgi:ATP-dependent helicase/nuclease subunit A
VTQLAAPDRPELRDADVETRRLAQHEFERPLLVEAGAGTGKTSVLVSRIVAWCLGPGWTRAEAARAGQERPGASDAEEVARSVIERVVAITFTEAAAAEMEERVVGALERLGSDDDAAPWPVGLDRRALPDDPEVLRRRSRALLASFDRLRVSTIHAFCRSLLLAYPLEADVHPRFAVDARGLARIAAAREAVEAWLFDPARAGDPDLAKLVEAGIAGPELETMLDALLASALSPDVFGADPLAPERIAAFVARLCGALDAFAAAEGGCLSSLRASALGRRVTEAVGESRASRPSPGPDDAETLGSWLARLGELWPRNLAERLGRYGDGSFPSASERSALGGRAGAVAAAARDLSPLLRHACHLDPLLLACVHRVLAPLHRRAAEQLRRAGQESFDALLCKARTLVEEHPEVAARIRAGIDQLLVDEFQDTDAAQGAIVERLALDSGARAGGPGLFVVGDPKQSIYGWRNADLAAYERFRERLVAVGGVVHRLSVNHRSARAILDEVEHAMRPLLVEQPRLQPAFQELLAARPSGDAGGAEPPGAVVEHWISSDWDPSSSSPSEPPCVDADADPDPSPSRDREERAPRTTSSIATRREAARLAADLLRQRGEGGDGWHWRDVGILVRSTGDLDVYLEALREAGIPYTVARDRRYAQRREVVEARALVRAVLDPNDQISLVAALRAPWAGVPDVAWLPLWRRRFPDAVRGALAGDAGARARLEDVIRGAATEVRSSAGDVPGLPADWELGLLHALEVLLALRRSFESESAERFVERLRLLPLLEATEAARFLGAWRLANLERFFRELGETLLAARGDPSVVVRALRRDAEAGADWDEGRPQHPSEDAVQVMTIHGAKGLEFEHVYLLQLHAGRSGRDGDPFRAGTDGLAGEWGFGAPRRLDTLGFDAVRAARQEVERREQVRTLYVAMTRARRRLVLAGHWSKHDRVGVHGALLAESLGDAQAQVAARARAAGEAWDGVVEDGRVRWVFLDPAARAVARRAAPAAIRERDRALDLETVRADSARLAGARREAAARAARPLVAPATAAIGSERREQDAARAEDEAHTRAGRTRDPAAEVAAAVGTAVHALLERLPWSGVAGPRERDRIWERERARLLVELGRRLPPEQVAPAQARAASLLDRIAAGPLRARLAALEGHVAARELPVLIEPEADGTGPVGCVAGTIDLLHRDPETGAWVIVDFKTDRVEDESELAPKAERYRAQARAYGRAVARALELEAPPRFELWFLDAGKRVAVEP